MAQAPRGIRNNNPLNIVKGQNWLGERHPQTDKRFEEFQSLELGIRAAIITIRTYIYKHRCDTPTLIIHRWAPPCENNTAKYIEAVCAKSNLKSTERIKHNDKNKISRLLWAMSYVENGVDLPFHHFERAWAYV